MVALGELLALPVAIFTTTHLGIDNLENKTPIWWPQLLKELTDGDGYKQGLNQMLYRRFLPTRSLNAPDLEGNPRWETSLVAARHD